MENANQRSDREQSPGVWDDMAAIYARELEPRLAPVAREVTARVDPRPGEQTLDLGTGTGTVAVEVGQQVGPDGRVVAVDVSPAMLEYARGRVAALRLHNVEVLEGTAERIPAADGCFDVVLSSLCLMFVPDRAAAAREIARVLRPGGRFAASVWAGPEQCDIVRFQQIAGRFAPEAPAREAGPGALADPSPFVAQLTAAGIAMRVETMTLGFEFGTFSGAWNALARVTAASLPPERVRDAAKATQEAMGWDDPNTPRLFFNAAHLLIGAKQR